MLMTLMMECSDHDGHDDVGDDDDVHDDDDDGDDDDDDHVSSKLCSDGGRQSTWQHSVAISAPTFPVPSAPLVILMPGYYVSVTYLAYIFARS